MKIVVLMGSPNRKGSTSILVENFTKGAEEAGHSVEVINVCHADIHPCTGCVRCGYEGPCVQKDDVEVIRRQLLGADMVVFATPLYYYGMVLGYGCGSPSMTKHSRYPQDAYRLGKSL